MALSSQPATNASAASDQKTGTNAGACQPCEEAKQKKGDLVVTVTSDGKAVENATVSIKGPRNNGPAVKSDRTGKDGATTFKLLRVGEYDVDAKSADNKYEPGATTGHVPADGAGQAKLNLKIVVDHWLDIEMVDKEGSPITGEEYELTVPGESKPRKGKLDPRGKIHIGGIKQAGDCRIVFPKL